jgi:YlmC/YmxH family sporulation protein
LAAFIYFLVYFQLCLSYISIERRVGGKRMVKISDFQIKDVVNVFDGRKLGNIGDIEINLHSGRIEAVIIGGSGKVLGFFGKDDEIVIPWKNIIKIGEDVILVRFKESEDVKYLDTEAK